MRIAITGGNGFLAGYLTKDLISHGSEVVLLSREAGSRFDIPYIVTDYSAESLNRIFSEMGITGIAHLASSRKPAESLSFYQDLMDMTDVLYKSACQAGIRNIVHTSSISVYSGDEMPYTEEQIPSPKSMYGLYKLNCEYFGEMMNKTQDMRIKNIRLAHLYGANENNNYMINKFFRQAFAHEQLYVHCVSVAKREMMYAKDAARAVRIALDHEEILGTFNTGSGEALTNEEIAKTICSVMSPEMTVSIGTEKEKIQSSYMSSQKAESVIGFKAQYKMLDAVKEIMEDMG